MSSLLFSPTFVTEPTSKITPDLHRCLRNTAATSPFRIVKENILLRTKTFPSIHRPNSRYVSCSHGLNVTAIESSQEYPEREEGMPIPGTITFRRSSTQTHYEYLTDLETLGMESFSSELSRSVSLSMGVRHAPESEPSSTPVAVSIDVTKEGRDLRLDGIVRTSISLSCSRCGIPVGERVFGEFSLLLTEKPVIEPNQQSIGVVLGNAGIMLDEDEDLEEILDLDLDDKMHFPRTQKSIDISKYIRDTVFLEIPLQCLCALSCRGRCFQCGVNLNKKSCKCNNDIDREDRREIWGPLEELKRQLENNGSTSD